MTRAAWALVAALAGCGPGDAACSLARGDLVITEVFADATGADAGREWFEVYNASAREIDLDGVAVVHGSHSHRVSGLSVAPHAYATLGNADPGQLPPYVDYGYGATLGDLAASGGTLALACGTTEIDRASWGAIKAGHARELSAAAPPDAAGNDDPTSWCQATDTEFATGNFGTPGSASDCVPLVVGQCNAGGVARDVVSPAVGDVVITEVMPSPSKVADAGGEWFEAIALRGFDLNGLGLDRLGDSVRPDVIDDAACLPVLAGERMVFARSADAARNGGLPAIRATFGFALVADGDVAIVAGATVLDAVSWSTAPTGAALALDPARTDPAANDDPTNFCAATVAYGAGDLGTPGAPNVPCPAVPPPGSCDDHGTPRPIVRPVAGQLAITEVLANPANVAGFTDAQREWFEVTNVGPVAFDLNELGLGRIGGAPHLVQAAACLSVPPGGAALFARSNDAAVNAMLPPVDATFSFGLVDTGGDVAVTSGGTVLDQLAWPSVTSGVSLARDASGKLCAGTVTYGDGTNRGTPGAENPPCP